MPSKILLYDYEDLRKEVSSGHVSGWISAESWAGVMKGKSLSRLTFERAKYLVTLGQLKAKHQANDIHLTFVFAMDLPASERLVGYLRSSIDHLGYSHLGHPIWVSSPTSEDMTLRGRVFCDAFRPMQKIALQAIYEAWLSKESYTPPALRVVNSEVPSAPKPGAARQANQTSAGIQQTLREDLKRWGFAQLAVEQTAGTEIWQLDHRQHKAQLSTDFFHPGHLPVERREGTPLSNTDSSYKRRSQVASTASTQSVGSSHTSVTSRYSTPSDSAYPAWI